LSLIYIVSAGITQLRVPLSVASVIKSNFGLETRISFFKKGITPDFLAGSYGRLLQFPDLFRAVLLTETPPQRDPSTGWGELLEGGLIIHLNTDPLFLRNEKAFFLRVLRGATYLTGLSIGLGPCSNPDCPMSSGGLLRNLDSGRVNLCNNCRDKAKALLRSSAS